MDKPDFTGFSNTAQSYLERNTSESWELISSWLEAGRRSPGDVLEWKLTRRGRVRIEFTGNDTCQVRIFRR